MRITDLVTPASIAVGVRIEDKSHALRFAGAALARPSGLPAERIREALAGREALGSTGIGQGVAVPHVCMSGIEKHYAVFFTLGEPIAFDSIDEKPVDLICAIISPASCRGALQEPLSHLAAISRILRDRDRAAALRKANNPWAAYDIIVKASASAAQFVS
jgi:nitrogen PTS system EIIA component